MSFDRHRFLAAALALVCAWGSTVACGKKGDPLPPVRMQPAATKDLTVAQRGREILLTFGYPRTTVAGTPLAALERVEVWQFTWTPPVPPEGVPPAPLQAPDARVFAGQATAVLEVTGKDLAPVVFGDRIALRLPPVSPPAAGTRQAYAFAVKTRVAGGEESEASNLAVVELREAPAGPRDVKAESRADGVLVSWQPGGESGVTGYLVYRRDPASRFYGPPLATLGPEIREYLDAGAAFGSRAVYAVTAAGTPQPARIESALTAELEIHHEDRFPPPAPRGLVALAEVGRVRIVWDAVATPDLAGYRVYRRDPGSEDFQVVGELITERELTQEGLSSEAVYFYRVTAVDRAGNESEPSGIANARIR